MRNQKGMVHILALLILVAGVLVGLYLVKNPTIFRPKAFDPMSAPIQPSTYPCTGLDCNYTPMPVSSISRPMRPTDTIPPTPAPSSERVCIQVITYAKDPVSGNCQQFPNPCVVPEGWTKVNACTLTRTR